MYVYKPLPRTCARCGIKGTTSTIQSHCMIKTKGFFSSVYMDKWKSYCKSCVNEVDEIVCNHMLLLDVNRL